jgi:pimeloyl-ACP methyl ester carboxylesterase
VAVPSLFIGGSADPVLVMSPPEAAEPWLLDHRGTILVDGAGHWVPQERPDEVNAALLRFVGSVSD